MNKWKFIFIACLMCVATLSFGAYAEDISLVKQFSSLGGTVEFLPGAWVSVFEDGKSTYYKYQTGKYVRSNDVPTHIKDLEPMDWGDFDLLSQLGFVQQSDFRIDAYVPKQAKIKKIVSVPIVSADKKELLLVCYSLKTTDPYPIVWEDIFIKGFIKEYKNKENIYNLLWTKKLETEAYFGNMQVEYIQPYGRFLVLYWGEPTGDDFIAGLSVYRLEGI